MMQITLCEQVLEIGKKGIDPSSLANAAMKEHKWLSLAVPGLRRMQSLRFEPRLSRHAKGVLLQHLLIPDGQLRLDLNASKKRPARSIDAFEQDIALIRQSIIEQQDVLDGAAAALRREADNVKPALAQLRDDVLQVLSRPGETRTFFPDDDALILMVPNCPLEVPESMSRCLSAVVMQLSFSEARLSRLWDVEAVEETASGGKFILRPQGVRFTDSEMDSLMRSLKDDSEVRFHGVFVRNAINDRVIGAQLCRKGTDDTGAMPPVDRGTPGEPRALENGKSNASSRLKTADRPSRPRSRRPGT